MHLAHRYSVQDNFKSNCRNSTGSKSQILHWKINNLFFQQIEILAKEWYDIPYLPSMTQLMHQNLIMEYNMEYDWIYKKE